MTIDDILAKATSDHFWVPDDVGTVDRPEISYTFADRPEAHFNRVSRVRPDLADPEALVDEVVEAHGGSASQWALNPTSDTPSMRRALEAAGYEAGKEHHAYAIETASYDRDVPDEVEVREVSNIDDLRELYAIGVDVFGGAPDLSEEDLAGEVEECTGAGRRVARFIAYRNGEPAGAGGLTFFDDLSFGLIWAGGVREAQRGRGVYTSLLQARADVAVERGIEQLGLYARNETSAPIVEAHGFERYGRMVHWNGDLRTGED